ncbi:MAG: class I SAM-dependent methyltransferase [Thermodesulfobacteriota bacterium]|nr:class I SAM-dependent methyltransferase [Thermodesulfobacteriota bacterium]
MKVEDIASMSIRGFLAEDEGMRLYELASVASKIGPCLEIGSYCGKSTLYMAFGYHGTGRVVFSVDHHRGSEEQQPGQEYFDEELFDEDTGMVDTFSTFRRNISRVSMEDTIVPIISTSGVLAKNWATPLGMVFIDGSHSYSSAFMDYSAWAPQILPGGIFVIHDIFSNPSKGGQAPYYMYSRALDSGLFAELPMVNTLGALRRLDTGEVPEHIAGIRDWG